MVVRGVGTLDKLLYIIHFFIVHIHQNKLVLFKLVSHRSDWPKRGCVCGYQHKSVYFLNHHS